MEDFIQSALIMFYSNYDLIFDIFQIRW